MFLHILFIATKRQGRRLCAHPLRAGQEAMQPRQRWWRVTIERGRRLADGKLAGLKRRMLGLALQGFEVERSRGAETDREKLAQLPHLYFETRIESLDFL